MPKRRQGDRRKGGRYNMIDCISSLPDELLLVIISLLSFKEAVATSVLSTRWRNIWTFTPSLNFDGAEKMSMLFYENYRLTLNLGKTWKRYLKREKLKHVKSIDKIVKLHRGSSIEEFRISFCLDNNSMDYIDKWVEYALMRNVERLELDFYHPFLDPQEYEDLYRFPDDFLRLDKGIDPSYGNPNPSSVRNCVSTQFWCLQYLCLRGVRVTGEVLERLLSICPLLEHMYVEASDILVNLTVAGPSLALKHLEISGCSELKSLEVRDLNNLISLKYSGESLNLVLEHVPLLVEVMIGGWFDDFWNDSLDMISGCLSQLEVLTLDHYCFEGVHPFDVPRELTNLKKLVLSFEACHDISHFLICSLLDASPRLEKLVLLVRSLPETRFDTLDNDEIEMGVNTKPYLHLKEVEFYGYSGTTHDIEFVNHIFANAVVLETIVINSSVHVLSGPRHRVPSSEAVLNSNEVAKTIAEEQLAGKISGKVDLVII